MNLNLFQQKTDNLFAENRLLKICFVLVLLISLSNWQAIRTAFKQQKTVVIPLSASGDLWVSGNQASETYLRHMARYLTAMIGNYTASTARRQFEEILHLYGPAHYAEAKTGFEKLSDQIERYPTVSSRVTWVGRDPMLLDEVSEKITIQLEKERLVNGDVTRTEDKTIEIDYYILDGRFWIEAINEKERT